MLAKNLEVKVRVRVERSIVLLLFYSLIEVIKQ